MLSAVGSEIKDNLLSQIGKMSDTQQVITIQCGLYLNKGIYSLV